MPSEPKAYKYLGGITIVFVTCLLVTVTVASKLFAPIMGFSLNGGAVFIVVTYVCGGVVTEVYGFPRTRRMIWQGFFAAVFVSLAYWLVGIVPAAPTWPHQEAYNVILGAVPRVVTAGLTAYLAGEFVNSYVWSRLKIASQGRHLWSRVIGSGIAGQAVDTGLFVAIAFSGTQDAAVMTRVSVSIYLLKVIIQVAATPIIYVIVKALRRGEGEALV